MSLPEFAPSGRKHHNLCAIPGIGLQNAVREFSALAATIAMFPSPSETKISPLLDLDNKVAVDGAMRETSPDADEGRL